ncbi:hypothetical protein E2C01_072572 [Portunus trituberculatus]|uniref:Uncharacterized protein n=1 Tax=Portunus trituberculatus TaxID=210409 RepID=A0A5B7IBP4_PORTR|nr:hypothetical protein [Portunus trituberculatus]
MHKEVDIIVFCYLQLQDLYLHRIELTLFPGQEKGGSSTAVKTVQLVGKSHQLVSSQKGEGRCAVTPLPFDALPSNCGKLPLPQAPPETPLHLLGISLALFFIH